MDLEHSQPASVPATVPTLHKPDPLSLYVKHSVGGKAGEGKAGGGKMGGGREGGRGKVKGSTTSGQLKPSFSWVGATAGATHLSVTGRGTGDAATSELTSAQTREPDVFPKSHASSPVRSRTA